MPFCAPRDGSGLGIRCVAVCADLTIRSEHPSVGVLTPVFGAEAA